MLLVTCGGNSEEAQSTPTVSANAIEVRIGDMVIQAEVARTPQERSLGLGERDSLPEDGGMLFVMESEARHGFWMKGMRFGLDFIWISADRRVADVTTNVLPEPGVADAQLTLYRPQQPALYVLEVNAGVVERYGVEVGDAVEFTLP